ncbi:uncharacterized protein LOC113512051 [Galleria mellonella]|uniref:Uncharacterized protein LOC113512051 n=1 Tax=Galleria mellonella TaxID=7137 RepID=A0A6J3BZM6_GALME|nr:uncharacterized protein LOC113512051 [Galleria mellonella]
MAHYEDIVEENGELKCILCMDRIPDNKSCIEDHLNGDKHKHQIVQKVLVKNGMVFNNNNISCLLCNQTNIPLLNGGYHINNSSVHQKLLEQIKEIVEKDGAFLNLPNDVNNDKVHCLICDVYFSFNLYNIENHINSDLHRRARSIVVQPLNGIFSVEDSDGDLWCKICPTYFGNYIEAIFQHVDNDKNHKLELRKLLKLVEGQNISIEKFLIDPKEYNAICEKCDTKVPCNLDNLERHIKGERHRK